MGMERKRKKKEKKKTQRMGELTMSMDYKGIIKLPRLIYKFHVIPVKITLFLDVEKKSC